MPPQRNDPDRRTVLKSAGAVAAAAIAPPLPALAAASDIATRPIPSSGERIPIVGMGSWITFNVGESRRLRDARTEVLRTFFALGGGMIDSSPMYGSSEAVIGYGLERLGHPQGLISATKVWTSGRQDGIEQMARSQALWAEDAFDLMQIHNMVDWHTHYETLRQWKQDGRIRYIGITTSHGRRHAEMAAALTERDFDFVQLTYNIVDRQAEAQLLPLAAERGIGVILNRPFRRGALFDSYEGNPLPEWAAEFDCANWAQFFLKFALSHPAVTCAIPATSRVDHMKENMGAGYGRLPDPDMRERMARYVASL